MVNIPNEVIDNFAERTSTSYKDIIEKLNEIDTINNSTSNDYKKCREYFNSEDTVRHLKEHYNSVDALIARKNVNMDNGIYSTDEKKCKPANSKAKDLIRAKAIAKALREKDFTTTKELMEKVLSKNVNQPGELIISIPQDYETTMEEINNMENNNTECNTHYEEVNHPNHYNVYDVEVVEMMERIFGIEETMSWCKLNAFKYRMRAGEKPTSTVEKDLKKEKPLQQIFGYCEFLDVRINLNKQVLIPRVETEEIVLRIIKENKEKNPKKIADICSGSGCIAIALKRAFSNAEVFAYELSEEALKKSKENANYNKEKIFFFKENILESKEKNQGFNIIVSNPPYVRESEKALMKNNVLLYEPSLALFVSDEDPLIFYKHILEFCERNLAPNGKVYLEINEFLAKETELLFKDKGYQTSIFKDIRGKDRLLFAKKD